MSVKLTIISEMQKVAKEHDQTLAPLTEDLVLIDVYSTGLITRGTADVAAYRRVFDMYDSRAVTAIVSSMVIGSPNTLRSRR